MDILREFHGPNAGYVLELYEKYRENPDAVDAATRAAFDRLSPADVDAALDGGAPAPTTGEVTDVTVNGSLVRATLPADMPQTGNVGKIMGVVQLAQAIREYGHLGARLDPLGSPPPGDPTLSLETHGLTKSDLTDLPASLIGGPVAERSENALDAIAELRRVYSTSIGYDYDHLRQPEERRWLRDAAESRRFRPRYTAEQKQRMLRRLTEIEGFEQFLHRTFQAKTRFSIEGLDTMVPILDEILAHAAETHLRQIVMGMAHRGRLNVLAHVLHKPYEQILAEFKDPDRSSFGSRIELGWMGDVKYHEGARRAVAHDDSEGLSLIMAPNPSHLEHVNPVVEGMVRAADSLVDEPGETRYDHISAMALMIHGDASFPGQGVVAETLNFSNISGYRTGGTIHIIANNQLGFTTSAGGGRSTLYASDLAKGFKIPIVHVNADDPEACVEVARLAFAYRSTFNKDFLIDLVGYRRHGHNEGDEPRFTQPVMYEKIDEHPSVRAQWAEKLVREGVVDDGEPQRLLDEQMDRLREMNDALEPDQVLPPPEIDVPPRGAARKVVTKVDADRLRAFNRDLLTFPEGFTLHRRLERILKRRIDALDEPAQRTIDWGMAESLAFASILADGTAIRLTGEDSERGTFSHRHALIHDAGSGEQYVPLQNLPGARASFEVRNSPLSENAAVAFEYGYNIQAPDRLCIWEAQYGDFINGAQAMIDEFVVSGRAKWEQTPSLVLLLPHGYEGQGPDHSTGRLERFLQLAAETNIRIANPTTAGQYFHLLRRQALLLEEDPLPLIVMTPKSLLRHPRAMSSLEYLANGRWQTFIDDPDLVDADSVDHVRRVVFCSGKLFVDLVTDDQREAADDVALVRIEQLYPFPADDVAALLDRYPAEAEIVWAQEEPANMGAWEYVRPRLRKLLGQRPLRYIGRPRSASPAEGSTAFHNRRQSQIVAEVFKK